LTGISLFSNPSNSQTHQNFPEKFNFIADHQPVVVERVYIQTLYALLIVSVCPSFCLSVTTGGTKYPFRIVRRDVVCVLLENMNSLDWSLSHAAHALQRRAPLPFPNLTTRHSRLRHALLVRYLQICQRQTITNQIDALRASCGVTVRHTSNGCRPGCLRLHDFFIGL
jgi:hypothetical protein